MVSRTAVFARASIVDVVPRFVAVVTMVSRSIVKIAIIVFVVTRSHRGLQ